MGFEPALGRPTPDGATYELLRGLGSGQLGPLALGRASGDSSASRFVVLRGLPASDFARLEAAIRRAASIAHPRLVKVLGLAWVDEVPYLASEYVEGLPVGDLTRELARTETSVMQEVALTIALDTLRALSDARAELSQRGVTDLPRCLYPDTAWVATFGETLLSDVGVASELARRGPESPRDRAWSAPGGSGASSATDDVFATGALLFELLTGRDLATVRSENATIPALDELPPRGARIAKPLVDLVRRALALDPSQRFRDPEDMASAIQELPAHWLGNEAQVRAAIEPLAHRAADLKASEPSLDLSSGEHLIDLWEIPTRSLRLRVPSAEDDRLTLRPESVPPSVEASTESLSPSIECIESGSESAEPRRESVAPRSISDEPSGESVAPRSISDEPRGESDEPITLRPCAPEPARAVRESGSPPSANENLESPSAPAARKMWLLAISALILVGGVAAYSVLNRHASTRPSLDTQEAPASRIAVQSRPKGI